MLSIFSCPLLTFCVYIKHQQGSKVENTHNSICPLSREAAWPPIGNFTHSSQQQQALRTPGKEEGARQRCADTASFSPPTDPLHRWGHQGSSLAALSRCPETRGQSQDWKADACPRGFSEPSPRPDAGWQPQASPPCRRAPGDQRCFLLSCLALCSPYKASKKRF